MRTPAALIIALSLVTIATLVAPAAQAQHWTQVPLGTTSDLYAVENTYLAEHWVVGANGFAVRSNSDRTQWTLQDPGTQAALFSVQEPTGGEIFVGAGSGVVRLKVYSQWFQRDLPVHDDYRLFTRTGAAAIVIGSGGHMLRTTDAGNTWLPVVSGTTANLNGGEGLVTGRAWVVGDGGTILRTTDGLNWTPVTSRTTVNLRAVIERDLIHIYAVGDNGTILKSSDGGVTWGAKPSGTTASLRAISISKRDSTRLIAAGLGGTVIKSIDSGETWGRLVVPTTADLYGAEAVTDSEYLVCGAGGLLLRTTDGGGPIVATGVGQNGLTPGDGRTLTLDLSGPYPQPSTLSATLRLAGVDPAPVRAEVFDVSGRAMATVSGVQATAGGDRVITLDTAGWPSGIYLVRVRSGNQEAVRRLVVTR